MASLQAALSDLITTGLKPGAYCAPAHLNAERGLLERTQFVRLTASVADGGLPQNGGTGRLGRSRY